MEEKKIPPKIPKKIACHDLDGSFSHNMAYYEWEATGKFKHHVICLHALTHNGRMFDYLAKNLSQHGFHVICPDIVGRGKSDYLIDKTHYGYPLYVKSVFELIDRLGLKKVHIVGTSMGGIIATMITGSERNLKENIVQKLVLNDVGPFIPKEAIKRISEYVGKRLEFDDLEHEKRALRLVFKDFGLFNKKEHEEHFFEHYIQKLPSGNYNLNYDPAISLAYINKRGKPRMAFDFAFWEVWEKIICEVMVIRGEKSDLLLQETLGQMCESKNIKKTLIINDVGHAPMLMESSEIHEVREFLER
ncbi:MAG: alpha/beta fold hydrolase [Alphaproteobacteria bacterium]|jgi:pimeloyl-ACP methyl ester carboxylesterase